MTAADLAAQTAAATAYQEFFVPALFLEWGPRVSAAARIGQGDRVLDVACGTGVLTRAAAQVVGPSGSVTGLDPNPGMLAVARRLAPALSWRAGSAEALPFDDHAFDVVVSQFGLMFFADRELALAEMWRVLRPGGRLAIAVWASLADTPAYAAEVALLERQAGPAAAAALRAPFVLGEAGQLAPLFARAGIRDARVETVVGGARFPSTRALVETDLRGWLPLMGVTLAEAVIGRILEEAEQVFQPFLAGDGTVRFASPAHIVTATRPD
jgi:SAM-dependent methyltransferase